MPPLVALLVFTQALGAAIGAVTSVWGELARAKAMRDGELDLAERAHLQIIAHGLRYGMGLMLLSSFGLVVSAYVGRAELQPALTASYWTLIALALIVISVSRSLVRRRVSFPIGSATLFTAWWFLVYLSFGRLDLPFGAAMMAFVVAAVIFYAILSYTHLLAARK